MGAINLWHSGTGEREIRVIFKGSLTLSLSSSVLAFSLQEKVSGVLPCLLWSAFTCSQAVWKVYENILKEMKTLQKNVSNITPSLCIKVKLDFLKRNTEK